MAEYRLFEFARFLTSATNMTKFNFTTTRGTLEHTLLASTQTARAAVRHCCFCSNLLNKVQVHNKNIGL